MEYIWPPVLTEEDKLTIATLRMAGQTHDWSAEIGVPGNQDLAEWTEILVARMREIADPAWAFHTSFSKELVEEQKGRIHRLHTKDGVHTVGPEPEYASDSISLYYLQPDWSDFLEIKLRSGPQLSLYIVHKHTGKQEGSESWEWSAPTPAVLEEISQIILDRIPR